MGGVTAGAGIKYDAFKPQSTSVATDALIEGGKKATELIIKGMGEVAKEEMKTDTTTTDETE